jgi:thiamine biosynthesis lipoprotein
MKETRPIMGMTVTIEIAEPKATAAAISDTFEYFKSIDEKFSTYKSTSEITAINKGVLSEKDCSGDMRLIFSLAEETKKATVGYFDIQRPDGSYDPSGIVKGWAIWNAAKLLEEKGYQNFYIDAGGDIETRGKNENGKIWSIGVKNPWNEKEVVKTIYASNKGIATSGTYIRGLHIYNPNNNGKPADELKSLTVIGPNIYEADRFATAAFAMGKEGIYFIQALKDLEAYAIDERGIATMTTGFEAYTNKDLYV